MFKLEQLPEQRTEWNLIFVDMLNKLNGNISKKIVTLLKYLKLFKAHKNSQESKRVAEDQTMLDIFSER